MTRALFLTIALGLILGGSLNAPFARDELSFEKVRRDHFDALAVTRDEAGPTSRDAPLVLRVRLLGDGADADLAQATTWLREHANVALVAHPDGAPLYLTRLDLAATSGRATLGATIPIGMAVEVGDDRVAPCVLAHEALHFLGLRHVPDERNIMSPQCKRDKLEVAILEPEQRAQLDAVGAIKGRDALGVDTWATRGAS